MTEADRNEQPRKFSVRYYRFRNGLKEKALGGQVPSGPGSISEEALAAAEEQFEKMAEDYPDWVQGVLTRLHEQHSRCVDTPDHRHQCFKRLNEIAHDMKGQGGTFGYNLISSFAVSLYEFTRPRETYSDSVVELVKAHVDAMKAVITGRVKGDGGEVGGELTKTLQQAIEKFEALQK